MVAHGLGSAGIEHTLEGGTEDIDRLQCEGQSQAIETYLGTVEIESRPKERQVGGEGVDEVLRGHIEGEIAVLSGSSFALGSRGLGQRK